MSNYVFVNDAAVIQDLNSYKTRLSLSGRSLESVINEARVSDFDALAPSTSPPPTYTAILAVAATAPWNTYARYLAIRSLGGFLMIPPALAGVISNDQRALNYTYDSSTNVWNTTITDVVEESRVGTTGPAGPTGPAGIGFVNKLAFGASLTGEILATNYLVSDGAYAVMEQGTRFLNAPFASPVLTVETTAASVVTTTTRVAAQGSLESITGSTANNAAAIAKSTPSAAYPGYSTGGLGENFVAGATLRLAGIVSMAATITSAADGVGTTAIQVASVITVGEELLANTASVANTGNVYLHFVRPVTGTAIRSGDDWYAYGYSSFNTSANMTISGVMFEIRSMLVSSGVPIVRPRGTTTGTRNRVVFVKTVDNFVLPA